MHARRFSLPMVVFSSVCAFALTTIPSVSQTFEPSTEEIWGPVKAVISPSEARVLANSKQRFKISVSNARYYRQQWRLETSDGKDATNRAGYLVWGKNCPSLGSTGSMDLNLKEDECDYYAPYNPPEKPVTVILKILKLKSNDEIARCTAQITIPKIEVKLESASPAKMVNSTIRATATAKNVSKDFYFSWYVDRSTWLGEKYHPIDQVYKDGTLTATADIAIGPYTSSLELSVYLMNHEDGTFTRKATSSVLVFGGPLPPNTVYPWESR